MHWREIRDLSLNFQELKLGKWYCLCTKKQDRERLAQGESKSAWFSSIVPKMVTRIIQ